MQAVLHVRNSFLKLFGGKLRATVISDFLQIAPAKFIYYSKYGLKHI